jgi:hypothetical protein
MNANDLSYFAQHPEEISSAETNALALLAKKYPWSQPLQMLYTKGLYNTKSVDYLEHLKYTAVLTSDRKVLYDFIMRSAVMEKIRQLDEEISSEMQHEEATAETQMAVVTESEPEVVQVPEPVDVSISERLVDLILDETPVIPTPETTHAAPETVVLTKDLLEDLISSKLQEVIREKSEKETPVELPSLELNKAQTSSEVVANDLPVEEETKTPREKVASAYDELEKQFLWEAVNASIKMDVMGELEKLPELEVKNPIPEIQIEPLRPKKETETPPQTEPVAEEKHFNWEQSHSFFTWLVPQEEKTEEPKINQPFKSKLEETEDLVDKFLKKEPRITPQKVDFYTAGNVAKLSIADTDEVVSETLASIYSKQGYFNKAIRAYEKLSLKFPEKSAYFASRIKELEVLQAQKPSKK